MAQKYFLPCIGCEQKILVETTQAGQDVRCNSCKTKQPVGTLREIKALDSADVRNESSNYSRTSTNKMSAANRAIFVIATLCLAIGGIFGAMQTIKSNALLADKPEVKMPEDVRKQYQAMDARRLRVFWERDTHDNLLATWKEHPFLLTQKVAKRARSYSYVGFGIAALGILGIIAALVLPNGRPRQALR